MSSLFKWTEPTSLPAADAPIPAVRNERWGISLDPGAATAEHFYLEGWLTEYNGGTLTLEIQCASGQASGDYDLQVEVEKTTGLDLDGDSFDTANASDNNTSPATIGEEFLVSVTLTNKDALVDGDRFRLKVTLKTSSGATSGLEMYLFRLSE